jgi:excisionase family DNA binding protein
MDKLLTVKEAAEMLRLAPGTIYHLISRHAVPCVKLSKRCVRFRQSELEQWVSNHSENCDIKPGNQDPRFVERRLTHPKTKTSGGQNASLR